MLRMTLDHIDNIIALSNRNIERPAIVAVPQDRSLYNSVSIISILLRVLLTSAVLILSLYFVYLYQNYDIWALIVGVILPLGSGIFLLWRIPFRTALFSFLAFYWSLVDDAPVYFDSVFTWPEVTRYHPFIPHFTLEVALHLLTALSFYGAIKSRYPDVRWSSTQGIPMLILVLFITILCYLQNMPILSIQILAQKDWYLLDLEEHLAALTVFLPTLFMARTLRNRQNRGSKPYNLT
jgi:hypothetical protein